MTTWWTVAIVMHPFDPEVRDAALARIRTRSNALNDGPLAKGRSLFAKVVHLESEAERIFGDLGSRDYLRGLGRAEFVREAGRLLADLNALHPFRDGNSRAQRAFLQLLARDGGWQFEWARVNAEVKTRLSAAAMVHPDALSPMLQDIVSEVGHRVLRTTWQCPVLHS